jgi:hypothetical protein
MRRISADRGLTFGLKCLIRGVGRDNEEAVIGTQLWFGTSDCHARRPASLKDANRIASIWFRQSGKYFDATIVNGI